MIPTQFRLFSIPPSNSNLADCHSVGTSASVRSHFQLRNGNCEAKTRPRNHANQPVHPNDKRCSRLAKFSVEKSYRKRFGCGGRLGNPPSRNVASAKGGPTEEPGEWRRRSPVRWWSESVAVFSPHVQPIRSATIQCDVHLVIDHRYDEYGERQVKMNTAPTKTITTTKMTRQLFKFSFIYSLIVLTLTMMDLSSVGAQLLDSPCPRIFQYRFDQSKVLYGMMVLNPPTANVIQVNMELSVGNRVEVIII